MPPFPGCPPLPPRPQAVEAAVAAAQAAAQAAARAEQQEASQEITVLQEKQTIFLREPEALALREQTLETVGVITAVGHPEKAAKKKKEAARPETRASSIKKVHLSKKHQREKRQREFKEQVVEFQKIQDKVAEKAAVPEESEIPQLQIRSVASVEQNIQNFDAICEGDILDLKEEPRLMIDECLRT